MIILWMGPALPALFVALGLTLLSPHLGLATDVPLWGGPGGNYFRAPCPEGSYLVGLAGRTSEWIDRIAPVCARWLRGPQTFGAPSVGPAFGTSEGGQAVMPPVVCQATGANTSAVQSWTIETLRSANRFVQYVGAICTSLLLSAFPLSQAFFEFGSQPHLVDANIQHAIKLMSNGARVGFQPALDGSRRNRVACLHKTWSTNFGRGPLSCNPGIPWQITGEVQRGGGPT